MKRARGDDQSDGEQQNKKRMHEAQVPQIELERQQRMARNKAMMEQLQLVLQEHAARLQDLFKANQPPKKKAPRQERPKVPMEPSRRSSRHDGREKPNYNLESKLYSIVERPAKKRRTGGADRSRSRDSGGPKYHAKFPAWHPDMSSAPEYAQEAARAAAEELVKKLFILKIFAQAKVLTESMVSGGFWLSVLKAMAAHLQVNSPVVFICDDETRPVEVFKDNQAARNGGDKEGRKWDVMFIDKGGSNTYGFSGNWRGFCIDQFLHKGDAVVFEVMDKSTVKVHLFRAWDFAAAKDKPADLDTTRFTRVVLQTAATADGAGDQAEQDTEEDVPAATAAAAAAGESGKGKAAAKASSKPSKKAADAGQKPAAGFRGKKLPAAAAAAADKPVRGKHSGSTAKAAAAVAGGKNSQGAPAANPPGKKAKASAAAAGAVAVPEAAAVGGRGRGSRGRGQQQDLQEPPARPSGRRTKAAAAAAAAAEVLAEDQGDDSSGGEQGPQAAVTGRKRRRAAAAPAAAQASTDAAPADEAEAQEANGGAEERRMPAGKAAAAAAKPAAETASPAEGRSSDESAAGEAAAADGAAPGAASAGDVQADRPEQGRHTGRFSWLTNLLPRRQE